MLDAEELKAEATDGADREPIHRALSDHLRAPLALKELGYEYVQISNWWSRRRPTSTPIASSATTARTSSRASWPRRPCSRAFIEPETAPGDPYDWAVMRMNTHYAAGRARRVPQLPGPKFVFAHLSIPHPPYLIDADGSAMDRAEVAEQGDDDSYVRYLRYANQRMLIVRSTGSSPSRRMP